MWEDISLTDAEDNGAAKDQPVPMSLEQSEVEMSEKNQMVDTLFPFTSSFCLISGILALHSD